LHATKGYISNEIQYLIKNTPVLIAGCGIGSTVAETLVRMGCENLTLVDNDEVSLHNLNRQVFQQSHVGKKKVESLKQHLLNINPNAKIKAVTAFINSENVEEIIKDSQFIFDTIDFLDLNGLLALHDCAQKFRIPVISSLAIGWGCGSLFFDHDSMSFRELFNIPEGDANYSYKEVFSKFLENIACCLDETVLMVVSQALTVMEDGKPCPASQVSPGAASVGALSGYLYFKSLSGDIMPTAPQMVYLDFNDLVKNSLLNTVGV
jgi:molybdopterin/thiamine biosynthesis adenylyltransferase